MRLQLWIDHEPGEYFVVESDAVPRIGDVISTAHVAAARVRSVAWSIDTKRTPQVIVNVYA